MYKDGKEYLDVKQSAAYIKTTPEHFYEMRARYKITTYKLDTTARRYILKDDLDKYIELKSPAGVLRNYFRTKYNVEFS